MSANRYLRNEYANIALGRNPKAHHIHKFGSRTAITTSPITIWDDGAITYPWSAFDTAAQALTVVGASDPNRLVTLHGLDSDYNEITEDVTVGSTSTKLFKRVYRAYMTDDGPNAGAITVRTGGATGTIVLQIRIGYSQTLMCVYTVPSNYQGLMLKFGCSASADKDMILEVYARFLDDQGNYGPFRIQHIANVYQGNYIYDFPIPLDFPPKTDIDIRVRGYSNDSGAKISASFDMLLHEINSNY